MIKVYVAGPYTRGDVAINVRNAFEAADRLADLGYAPFVPHSSHLWHILFPRSYRDWMDLDEEFLGCCDVLLRLPGESPGADFEVCVAGDKGIPVFHSVEEIVAAMPVLV
jgi:hypothetical protein